MAVSQIGKLIREARVAGGLSIRGLAKQIGKSPSYIVALETSARFPGSSDETLSALATALAVDEDVLYAEASRSPAESQPATPAEVGIQRLVKQLSVEEQEELLRALRSKLGAE